MIGVAIVPGLSLPGEEPRSGAIESFENAELKSGYRMLYELRFSDARRQFTRCQEAHPEELLGEVSIAASYLYEEFFFKGVFTSKYFLDDNRFLGGAEGRPDEQRKRGFVQFNRRAMDRARNRLVMKPADADALFALTLAAGMQSDYASVLEKRQLEGLRLMKEANGYANRLLAVRPDMADAWMAIGTANYIIGCLPTSTRFLLWFGGTRGDRRLGMDQLRKTAANGYYLKPFAKIFLALAALREKQEDVARKQFSDLVDEFPGNSVFASELALLTHDRTNEHSNGR